MDIDSIRAIMDYPDISFVNGYTLEQLEDEMISLYEQKSEELIGETYPLGTADTRRIILKTAAYYMFQWLTYLDDIGKMGLLKYSRGKYLENLGALKHIYRKGAQEATVTILFTMNEVRNVATGIPQGVRLTSGDGVYFATDYYTEIPAGERCAEVKATCLTAGITGNHYGIGEIKTIVDPVPFVDTAENITVPENGADIESDESLRERIYEAPAAYSTAGTADAYEFFVKQFNHEISDVGIYSPKPCWVLVRYLLKDGIVPGEESMAQLQEYLSSKSIRPVGDRVEVLAPDQVPYRVKLKYFINARDRSRVDVIRKAVERAIEDYQIWQKSKMGRDINPSELIRRVMSAGAKRIEVIEPSYSAIPAEAVAFLTESEVVYGGLEDD